MAVDYMVNKDSIKDTPVTETNIKKYMLMEQLSARLMSDRTPFDAIFNDVKSVLDPHMVMMDMYQAGFPDFVTDLFITSRHLLSFDDLMSGLQEGIMPAQQVWAKYGLEDEGDPLADDPDVWEHLHVATRKVQKILNTSNFYQQVPSVFRSVSRFATGAIMMERDSENFVRFTAFPVGSFFVSNNNKGVVDTICRPFRMKVREVIEEFCTDKQGVIDLSNCSTALRQQWLTPARHEEWTDIVMFIFPNPEYNSFKGQYASKFQKYCINYYEFGRNIGHNILREEGSHFFNVYVPRWFRQPTDPYGCDCPGIKARAPIRRMFKSISMYLNSVQKVLEPPVGADPSISGVVAGGAGTTPNFLTVIPGGPGEGKKFGPIYQIAPDLKNIGEYINECGNEIERLCMADIFRALGNLEGKTPLTATEVLQRVQENSRVLGPVFGAFNYDWIQPMMRDLYWMMVDEKEIPSAPQQMHGANLKVEVMSRIAIALKQGDLNATKEFVEGSLQLAQVKAQPGAERLNADEVQDYRLKLLNLPPHFLYSDAQVAKIRQIANHKAQQAQQAAQAEQASKTVKNLGQADAGGDTSLLQKIMQGGGNSAT